ncbi:MAG: CoB--CoM heterodisulfide reductase iron-sulfur subunit A family protein [Deltaproteobacteria bacterium]|nr:CoB--CoM heterodisulfide reductase iron-sulfur subunit A family protein [Deltaproteobacteria bacterium]MBW2071361.1 CoB--CoM heterodisulfide reductase iron-sulfur subunit A family protein [Deltaproteobacteria bacterium]
MSTGKVWPGTSPVDRVLVLGGGVAGIQASLDLAEAGYGVYLVEKSPQLGGLMPQLYRIYPLCSCCKQKDQIAAASQHPNIEIITNAELESFSGEQGNFEATVKSDRESINLKVGGVILAVGIEPFDPTVYDTYSYSVLPNVVTSMEFEGMQKPGGPTQGIVKRPSDGKVPAKIAWLQCVGSREINACDAPYCSSVCCMYALKEAVNVKENLPDTETSIFFMDLRAHGKGFEEYLNRAKELAVRLIRSRVHTVDSLAGTDDLVISYVDEKGGAQSEIYDMVVLSVGLQPSADSESLAKKLGISLTNERFVQTEVFRPVSTSVPGIFVCGALTAPQEINLSLVQASAAAAAVTSSLKPPTYQVKVDYPAMRTTEGEAPRVGVVFYSCPASSQRLGSLLDEAAAAAANIEAVVGVESLAAGNGDVLAALSQLIQEKNFNRLVFASCTPAVHKPLVEEALARAGLDRCLYDLVDLRTLGGGDSQRGMLIDLVKMSVVRAALLEPQPLKEIAVSKSALVVGGGIAGMESAIALASHGFPVTLVEQSGQLGGHARKVRSTWQGQALQDYLEELIRRVEATDSITVMKNAEVVATKGVAGHFVSTVQQDGTRKEVEHGATILAVGGASIETAEYLCGSHPRVFRWVDLNEKLQKDPAEIHQAGCAVFIQCVGSREPQRPYCSKICCSYAVRTAVDLKEKNPDMKIYVLYREMRTYGFIEELYKEARQKGVVFIRYTLEQKPEVQQTSAGGLEVTVVDHVLQRSVKIFPDFISLQTAIESRVSEKMTTLFKVSQGTDGFLVESPAKMRPVDSETEGVFFAGLAVGPKFSTESIAEAWAAAGRAMGLLAKDRIRIAGIFAQVDPEKCAVCCTCVRTCPFQVPFIDSDEGAASIDPVLCQGCGMCVSECPGKAINMAAYTDEQIIGKISATFSS